MSSLRIFDAAGQIDHLNKARSLVGDSFSESDGYPGNYFCDTSRVQPMKALYNRPGSKLTEFTTVFRILPGRSPYTKELEAKVWRYSTNKGDFSSWMDRVVAWRNGGNPGITFIVHDPKTMGRYDMRDNPGGMLYYALSKVSEDKSLKSIPREWPNLIKGGQGRPALVVMPKQLYLVQAAVYRRGDKDFDSPQGVGFGNRPVLFDLAAQGGMYLQMLLDDRVPEWRDHLDDFDRMYRCGNPIDVDGGLFVAISPFGYKPGWYAQETPNLVATTRTMPKTSGIQGGYEIDIYRTFMGRTPELTHYAEELETIEPISDSLKVFDTAQQAAAIASVLRLKETDDPRDRGRLLLDVLEYSWQGRQDWLNAIPEELWDEYRGKTVVNMPAIDAEAMHEAPAYVQDTPTSRPPLERARSFRNAPSPGVAFNPPTIPSEAPEASAPAANRPSASNVSEVFRRIREKNKSA